MSLILILSIGIIGCTKITTKNKVEEEIKGEEVEEEKVVASVKTSYIEDDILSYKATLEFEHDNEIVFQNKYSDMEGIFTFRGNSLRNSPSFGYANLAYFADNGGVIQCVDLNNLKPVWSIN